MRLVLLALVSLSLTGCINNPDEGPSDPNPVVEVWPQWGALESAILRPGSEFRFNGAGCTYNFLYERPDGTGYIGTAAHCTEAIGDRVVLVGHGEVGAVVYDSDLVDSPVDFALIQLDPESIPLANPRMMGFDGPHGSISVDGLAVGDEIHVYGHGIVVGQEEPTRARTGVLAAWTDDEYQVDMPATNGDSGGPLLHESGQAFGIVSEYGFFEQPPSTDHGPMMGYIFRELADAGFEDVRLVSVPT